MPAALVGGLTFRQSVNDLCRGFLLGLAEISRMPILPLNRIPASGHYTFELRTRVSLGHLATATLDRRTCDRAVRTEHAAVTRPGFETRAAAAAVIEEPAGAGWHGLNGLMTAVRASDRGVQAHGRGNPITKMPVSGCYRVSAIIHAKAGTPIIPAEIAIAKRTVFATSQRNMRPPTKMLAGLP